MHRIPAGLSINAERPVGSEIAALIDERLAYSHALLPPESVHTFGMEQLDQPDIIFWTARMSDALVGCGALKLQDEASGEIKSMFIRPAWRGLGISRHVLATIETKAREVGLKQLLLETGTNSHVARRLYERFGYVYRPPFGAYKSDPLSVFMVKLLS